MLFDCISVDSCQRDEFADSYTTMYTGKFQNFEGEVWKLGSKQVLPLHFILQSLYLLL